MVKWLNGLGTVLGSGIRVRVSFGVRVRVSFGVRVRVRVSFGVRFTDRLSKLLGSDKSQGKFRVRVKLRSGLVL